MKSWIPGALLISVITGCSDGGRDLASSCSGTGAGSEVGCGGGEKPPAAPPQQCPDGAVLNNGRCEPIENQCPPGEVASGDDCRPIDGLALEVLDRSACRVSSNGVTQIVVRFVSRDSSGRALGAGTQVDAEMLVDGQPLDAETLIDAESELLQSDLFLSLVLDASYSMTQQDPPAFAPMLSAAEEITTEASATWRANGSQFEWALAWFNELVYQPTPPPAWSIADIARIPPPEEGGLTGLYKAIYQMTAVHWQHYQAGQAAGERDQHIMIVLSDGADNHSFFDNSDISVTGSFGDNLTYIGRGEVTTELADLNVAFAQQPNLRVYVIGIGDNVSHPELEAIADAGNGAYFYDDDTRAVGELFDQVSEQFVTVETLGARTPLPPGEYEISIVNRLPGSDDQAIEKFTINTAELSNCGS